LTLKRVNLHTIKRMKQFFIYILILITGLSACKKLEASNTVLEESIRQEKKITDYIAANKLIAVRHFTGMYYIITDAGTTTNTIPYYYDTSITAKYTGRFLDGSVFSTVTNPTAFQLFIPVIYPHPRLAIWYSFDSKRRENSVIRTI
jgi:hypothetical protein